MSALTQAQKAKARDYLGVTMLSTNQDPRTYGSMIPYGISDGNLVMERNFNAILDATSLTIVGDLLDQIEESRAFITKARKLLIASKVEGAITVSKSMMRELWAEDYKLVSELANKLGTYVFWHHHTHANTGYGTKVVMRGR